MGFRSDECMPPEVVANVGAKVSGKVVAAHVIGAAGEAVTVELSVEPQVLTANSCHYIAAELLAELCAINGVEIVEDWAIGRLEDAATFRVNSLMCSPRNFPTETEVMLQDKEAAKAGVQSSAQ